MAQKNTKKSEYAAYRGDEFIFVGTIEEIVEYTGLSYSTVEFKTHAVAKKRDKGNGLLLYKLEEDED